MSAQFGGYIGFSRTPTFQENQWAASGVWKAPSAEAQNRLKTWPGYDGLRDSVIVLLHADGTNGSTTFTDSSKSPKTITANGDAKISTSQSKFGGSSIELDGTGDYLAVPSVSMSGAFTLECYVRWKSRSAYSPLVDGTNANTQLFLGLKVDGSGLRWGLTGTAEYGTGTFSWSNNTWYHVALVRNASNAFKVFVDGTDITSGTPSNSYSFSGTLNIGNSANAFFDEVRITTGTARYTANFTPFASAFPDR